MIARRRSRSGFSPAEYTLFGACFGLWLAIALDSVGAIVGLT